MDEPYVTLEEAKHHLRIDDDQSDGGADDMDLSLKILGASRAVRNYLKSMTAAYEIELDSEGEPVLDSNGDPVIATDSSGPIVKPEVKIATLMQIGYLYKDRDNDERHEYEMGFLPRPVTAILYPLRDPALR